MKAVHLLILSFCIISLFITISASDSGDRKRARDGSDSDRVDDIETSEPMMKLQKPEDLCSFCKTETTERSVMTICGHPHHASCIYQKFLSTDVDSQAKCPECQAKFNYYAFVKMSVFREDLPDEISFIRERLNVEEISKLTSQVIKEKNPVYLRNLLKLNVPFNEFPIFKGKSALCLITAVGTPEMLDILIKSGLQFVPAQENNVNQLLISAADYGNLGNIRYLLDQCGANINFIDPVTKFSALHGAVWRNKLETVKLLIEMRADLNLRRSRYGHSLHIAIAKGFDDITELLLKAGSSVKILNECNQTPFGSACYLNKLGAVKLLLAHGCKLDSFSVSGFNCLHFAILSGSIEIVEYLISINVSIQMQDGTSSYLLHSVTLQRKTKMIKYLLNIGANPYEKLQTSVYNLIIKKYPDLLGFITEKDPAIVLSILNNDKELVEAFLDAGIDPNTRIFNSNSTLLHFAIQKGRNEICELLVKRGADIHALDCSGRKPLSFASDELAKSLVTKYSESL